MSRSIDQFQDALDVRDIIERFEELETERENLDDNEAALIEWTETEDGQEYTALRALLDDLKGNGGDEQWRGDWYPVTLIRASYFVEAMRDLCEDIGDIPEKFPHYIEIDWTKTAENLRVDYTATEFCGVTYWYR